MRLWLCALVGLALVAMPVRAEEEAEKKAEGSGEAVEILKKVDAATKAVSMVRYSASFEATGAAAARFPKLEGTAVLADGATEENRDKFRVNVKGNMPGSDESMEFSAGTDGETYFLIDPAEKMVYADIDSGVLGRRGQIASALVMQEYTHPTPFSDEINADTAELRPEEKIGDVDCYVIHVIYSGGQGEAVWAFGKGDFLPRRVVRVLRGPSGDSGEMRLTLTDVAVNPSFVKNPFEPEVPEGFTKTDDFAP